MPLPQNGEEAAYLAFAITQALTGLLVTKGIVSQDEIDSLMRGVAANLDNARNSASKRAAHFVRNVMLRKDSEC
jgi:hypothetical protein